MPKNIYLPCLDSDEMAAMNERELNIDRSFAMRLGRTAVEISEQGWYINSHNKKINLRVNDALSGKLSIPPESILGKANHRFEETRIQVTNETTLKAAKRILGKGEKPLALNFANGIHPGGGFLNGALAQEENLCRSSALYLTLCGDAMYEYHASRTSPDSSDWVILSPNVPVFRTDDGSLLNTPYYMSFITCAAPVAHAIGPDKASALMQKRIGRIFEVSRANGYTALILGAWGCGAFRNDPVAIAHYFKDYLEGEYLGAFSDIVFAITDWSPERRFLGVFRDLFRD